MLDLEDIVGLMLLAGVGVPVIDAWLLEMVEASELKEVEVE